MSHPSGVVFLAVVEKAARPALLAQHTPHLTARSFSDGTLTPHGLVQLTLLTHPVFQTPTPDQIRDIRSSRVVPCRDRPPSRPQLSKER